MFALMPTPGPDRASRGTEQERAPPVPSDACAPRTPAAAVLALQQRAGNYAVSQWIAVQRSKVADADLPATAADIYMLATSDARRDLSDRQRVKLIQTLLDEADDLDHRELELAVQALWEAMDAPLERVAAGAIGAWSESVDQDEDLLLLPSATAAIDDFRLDVESRRDLYLRENRLLVESELDRVDPVGSSDLGYVEQLMGVARRVQQLQDAQERLIGVDLLAVPGADTEAEPESDSTTGDGDHSEHDDLNADFFEGSSVDTFFHPESPPQGTYWGMDLSQRWATLEAQYDELGARSAAYATRFPAIYAVLRDGGLEALAEQEEPLEAQRIVVDHLLSTIEAIEATEAEPPDYRKLRPIHEQLLAGRCEAASGRDWTNAFARHVAGKHVDDFENVEWWRELGFDTLVAASFVIASLASAGAATPFLLAGVGLGGVAAGREWSQYLELANAADAAISDELALVSRNQPEDALADAVLQTASTLFDALGVGKTVLSGLRPPPPHVPAGGGGGGGAVGPVPPARRLWGRWSDYPKVTIAGREYANVGGRLYTPEAIERLRPRATAPSADSPYDKLGSSGSDPIEGRGISPEWVEDVIANPESITHTARGSAGGTEYRSGSVRVVTEALDPPPPGVAAELVVTVIGH
jgi:hypothetical protein